MTAAMIDDRGEWREKNSCAEPTWSKIRAGRQWFRKKKDIKFDIDIRQDISFSRKWVV